MTAGVVADGLDGHETTLTVADGPFLAPALSRVVGILAARADCPIDRLLDVLLVTDAIAAKAGSFCEGGRVGVGVVTAAGCVGLRVGPLRPGGADGLLAAVALPGVGNVVERVADAVTAETEGHGGDAVDYLAVLLRFAGPDPEPATLADR